MANVIPPEDRFKITLLEFLDFSGHIIKIGKERGIKLEVDESVIPWCRNLIWLMPNKVVIKQWMGSSSKHWDHIVKRDTDEFITNIEEILPNTSKDFQDALVVLMRDHRISDNEIKIMWSYFEALVNQASKFDLE